MKPRLFDIKDESGTVVFSGIDINDYEALAQEREEYRAALERLVKEGYANQHDKKLLAKYPKESK